MAFRDEKIIRAESRFAGFQGRADSIKASMDRLRDDAVAFRDELVADPAFDQSDVDDMNAKLSAIKQDLVDHAQNL